MTGGFPYTVVMLALLVAWLCLKTIIETRKVSLVFPMLLGVALGFGLSAPAWLALLDYVQGSARNLSAASAHFQWIVPPQALPSFILPSWTVNWADFSTRYMPHTAAEMTCGLVPPVALLAGLITGGRQFVRRIRWELALLSLVLLLSMLPSAGVFRWSFRWLPFIHLILALCAAEALRLGPRAAPAAATARFRFLTPGVIGFVAVAGVTIAMFALRTFGPYAFPLTWILLGIAAVWALADFRLRISSARPACAKATARQADLALPEWFVGPAHAWTPVAITFAAFLATYLCIPANCGVPKYNLSQELTKPAPLDPSRLYLSIYPPAEHTYRVEKKPGPVGQIVRPGSTSMWACLRFVNGYSPILAAGVAREFKFDIHGEIDPDVGRYLIEDQARRAGVLEEMGVDGIVVAQEISTNPPASDWQLVFSNDEGRVFYRQAARERVRSVSWIDSRPNVEFATATVSGIADLRNEVHCEVSLPNDERPALLTFSRPFFRGYEARLGGKKLPVDSYRGLFPTVEVPPRSHGHVVLSFRPKWLLIGGGIAAGCAAVVIVSTLLALRRRV